jgi:hypothetical protein
MLQTSEFLMVIQGGVKIKEYLTPGIAERRLPGSAELTSRFDFRQ